MKAVRKLLVFAKPYWLWLTVAPIMMTLEAIMDLLQPTLISRIVDVGIANLDLNAIITTGLTMVGVTIIGAAGGSSAGVFATKAAQSFGADLREAVFDQVQDLSFSNLDQLETGNLVTRLTNDVTQVQNALYQLVRIMVRAPLMLVGSFIMFVITVPYLTLIPSILTVVILSAIILIISKAYPLYTKVQDALDNLNVVLQENLSGVRVVKAFVRANHEVKRFEKVNEVLKDRTIHVARVTSITFPLVSFVVNVGIVGVIWFGGGQFRIGEMTTGEIIAATNYLVQTLSGLTMVAMITLQFSRAQASAERIVDVLETAPTVQNKENPVIDFDASGRVAFERVSFGYQSDGLVSEDVRDRDSLVLDQVSFCAEPGETVAILGSTGSGKSTLVNLIPRFYDVTGGKITVDGVDIRDMDKHQLRSNVGMVLQETILFSGTIRDNIRFGRPTATDEDVIAAAKAAQAHDFIMSFPDGYNTILGQRGVNVSGGQKQRIAIARALLIKPAILILDDSTSSVDVETETKIQAELDKLMANRTSFVIAQRVSTVLTADKILVLDDGKIAAEGNHTELLATSDIYRDIYDSQLGNGGAQ